MSWKNSAVAKIAVVEGSAMYDQVIYVSFEILIIYINLNSMGFFIYRENLIALLYVEFLYR